MGVGITPNRTVGVHYGLYVAIKLLLRFAGMKMLLWVCNPVSRRLENGNVSIYMVDMEDMVALSEDFEVTQESMEFSQGQGIWKLKGKGPKKEKM